MSRLYRFEVGAVVAVMLAGGGVLAGELTPPGPPGATMRTLQEIYDRIEAIGGYVGYEGGDALAGEILSGKKAWVGGTEVTGTMPNVGQTNMTPGTSAQTITQGYHDGTGEVAGDANFVAANIKKDVTVFGVTGALFNAAVPKTGQTTSYRTGDDGDLEKGVAWPSPRFSDHDDGTVTDNRTGLIWVKAPHSLTGNSEVQTWDNAIDFCNSLTFAEQTDWRLPNVRELQSLVDFGRANPALPSDHPFIGILTPRYWSSSSYAAGAQYVWHMTSSNGDVDYGSKTGVNYVWPVRAGQ